MNTYFKELAEAYKVSTSTTVKSALYDAMVSYSKTYRGDYSCYDMDMFTTLYKCASTPAQRKDALNQMYAIIVDPALHYDELVENFKEFFSLNEVLANDDIDQFDNTCYYFLRVLIIKFCQHHKMINRNIQVFHSRYSALDNS